MTQQERAEALFSICANAVDKYGTVDYDGMNEAIVAIIAYAQEERRLALEEAAKVAENDVHWVGREIAAAIRQAKQLNGGT